MKNSVDYQGPQKGEEIRDRIPYKRLFSLKEAAVYLGKGLYGIRELVWSGKLPIVRDGRKQMIDREDLDKYIQACKVSYFLREKDERDINGRRKPRKVTRSALPKSPSEAWPLGELR